MNTDAALRKTWQAVEAINARLDAMSGVAPEAVKPPNDDAGLLIQMVEKLDAKLDALIAQPSWVTDLVTISAKLDAISVLVGGEIGEKADESDEAAAAGKPGKGNKANKAKT